MKKKHKGPKFSVITVVYNDVDHIEDTIKSALDQTYQNFEYIVIDGGSTDGTVDLIKKYSKYVTYWVSEPDGGIYDAMNKGVKIAIGDFLYFLNSNDYFYNKDVLKNVAKEYVKNKKAEILYGRQFFKFHNPLKQDGVPPQIPPEKRLPRGNTIYHQASFIKKSVFDKIGLFTTSYKLAGDYEFFCRCFVNGILFICIDEVISIFTHGGRGCETSLAYKENAEIVKKYFGKKAFLRCWFDRKVLGNSENLLKKILLKLGLKGFLQKLISIKNSERIIP
jgi:glycosyltransferase involved in cell wall biosynthesis